MQTKALALALSNTFYRHNVSATQKEQEYFSEFVSGLLEFCPAEFDKWFNYSSPSMVDDKKGWQRAQQELDSAGKTTVDFKGLREYVKQEEYKAVQDDNLFYFMKLEDLLLSLCSSKEKKEWNK